MAPLNYQLHKNKLTVDVNDYVARVRPNGSANLDDVIDYMIKLKGSTAVRGDVLSTLEDFFYAVESLLTAGQNVNTPLANFHLSIRGKFVSVDDSFDPDRHEVTPQVSTGPRLRKSVPPLIEVARKPLLTQVPCPEAYFDAGSNTRDQLLTPNSIGKLTGYYLRFEPFDDPGLGVFFLGNGGETRALTYSENMPGRLHFLVPDLAPGEYRLEVRIGPNGSGELRRGTLEAVLTVAP
jgi:hypothetical protein